jgi:monovalent cation:H+ antiporter-2, CPA2 family
MHDISLITTIAFGLTAALIFGLLAKRIGLSPIVGYLIAGIAVGPHTPGFSGDVHLAAQLAEIGVILLMFGVGLHFHFDDLMAVKSIAIPGAIGQSVAATFCGLAVVVASGWTASSGVVIGIAVSVASTVVLLRVLMDNGLVETTEGQVAVGWLVVEDIITVLVLVLLPALAGAGVGSEAGGGNLWKSMGIAVLKLAALGAVVAFVGTRYVPRLLLRVARLRSSELFTLTVLVIAMGVATAGFMAFNATMALGGFMAGMVVGQSKLNHEAGGSLLPIRDAFTVLFFVSVGMLFDYRTVLDAPWLVVGLIVVIMVVKPVVALLIVLVSGRSLRVGLTVAGGLAQIGEFSFIVAELGRTLKVLPDSGYHALVAAAIVSISLNPMFFRRTLALENWVKKFPAAQAWLTRRSEAKGQVKTRVTRPTDGDRARVVVVGYGPVGRTVARRVKELRLDVVVVDSNIDTVLALQAAGEHALFGDAKRLDILREAGVPTAAYVVITIPDTAVSTAIALAAREISPEIRIFARGRHVGDAETFERAGVVAVCYDEAEAATAMTVVLQADIKASGLGRSGRGGEELRVES